MVDQRNAAAAQQQLMREGYLARTLTGGYVVPGNVGKVVQKDDAKKKGVTYASGKRGKK